MPRMLDGIERMKRGGRVVEAGRTIGLVARDVRDSRGRLLAHASSTCMALRGDPAAGR
jgi:acyl-coenzyme A thioesterase PaaI-like protein